MFSYEQQIMMEPENSSIHPHPRSAERRRVYPYIEKLIHGDSSTKILNIYGLAGIGKTWLAYQLFAELPQLFPVTTVWIDFEGARRPPVDPARPIEALERIDDLAIREDTPLYSRLNPEALRQFSLSFPQLSVQWQRSSMQANGPLVVFFDGVNLLSELAYRAVTGVGLAEPPWEYLQRKIIKPLVSYQDILVICLSQSPLRWSYFELDQGERVEKLPLQTMPQAEVGELLAGHGVASFLDVVYADTAGHPGSIEYVLFNDHGPAIARNAGRPDLLPEPEDEGLTALASLAEQPDLIRGLLQAIGLLRIVDIPSLQDVPKLLEGAAGSPSGQPSIRLLQEVLTICRNTTPPLVLEVRRGNALQLQTSSAFRRSVEQLFIGQGRLQRYAELQGELQTYYLQRWEDEQLPWLLREWLYFFLNRLRLQLIHDLGGPGRQVFIHLDKFLREINSRLAPQALPLVKEDPELIKLLRFIDLHIDPEKGDYVERNPEPALHLKMSHDWLAKRWAALPVRWLFREKIPREYLSHEHETVLLWLLEEYGSGFNVQQLREGFRKLFDRDPSLPVLHSYLARYSEINLISYDYGSHQFVFSRWLLETLVAAAAGQTAHKDVEQ